MARKLKVYNGNWCGLEMRMVAATSKRAAAALIGVSLHEFNAYYGETSNAQDIATALAEPGAVFSKPYTDHKANWRRVKPAPSA